MAYVMLSSGSLYLESCPLYLHIMIGIFGGTFDPIHYGHIRSVREAFVHLGLRQLYFIPAARPPLREQPHASVNQRLDMLRLALEKESGFGVDEREIQRAGPSYTVDTLREIQQELGSEPVCLLLGMDAFIKLEQWHEWFELFSLAHIVVLQRPGWESFSTRKQWPIWVSERLSEEKSELSAEKCGLIYMLPVTPQDISATAIREAIACGMSIDNMVPPQVADYITRHNLYHA